MRPATEDEVRPDGVDDVAAARERLDRARVDLQAAVDRARAQGRTWAQLGTTLGISRQAAFKEIRVRP